jgi:hypothetical protein
MPHSASAGVLRFCRKANSRNRPPITVMNSVTANRVGTSRTTWETMTVGIVSPPHPFAGEYTR